MTVLHVPATPGNHVPDHDTFAAMSTMLAICLRIRREGIEPEWTGPVREIATWTLPDGLEIRRIRHKDLGSYKQTITASDPGDPMIGRLIIDHCTIVPGQEPDIAQCIDDIVIARTALESTARCDGDALAAGIETASIGLMLAIVDADGLKTDRSYSADHWPATPWRKARVIMQGVEEGDRIGTESEDFPMVVVVAVDEPYGMPARRSVRIFPYHMDHTLKTEVDPIKRLRCAEALCGLRKGTTS